MSNHLILADNGGSVLPPRVGDWMQTYTNRAYWPMDPRASEVHITDIAHSLAHQCRYAGHGSRFYSVAEHSVHVSRLVPGEFAMLGLMHDATEAYVVDVPRPLKGHLAGYAVIEERNWAAIAEAFGLPATIPDEVHDTDRRICLAEGQVLFGRPPYPWGIDGPTPEVLISGWDPVLAEKKFLARFYQLWGDKLFGLCPAAGTGYLKEAA